MWVHQKNQHEMTFYLNRLKSQQSQNLAQSKHGGFVANRLIFAHTKNTDLQRHVILAASGRWRICNPNSSFHRKELNC